MHAVLVVDDEPNYRLILSELIGEEGYKVMTAESADGTMDIVKESDLDLVITDMRMPGRDGMSLLRDIKKYNPELPVIMITAFGDVDKAVTAMQAGAFNYLTKPFSNEEVLVNVKKAVDHYQLLKENYRLKKEVSGRYSFANMIGKNRRMQEIYNLIEKVAPTNASVLVSGESGTGKELVARAIHFNSPRREGPIISINCAGLPEQLLESELFGHERGAFTGATALRKGRFELADHGTIFLDEIGEMPMTLQPKLLRVLQEKNFERVGGTQTIEVDVRIVAATNRELKDEVGRGNFREDLFYRLNVLNIHLPPLRERRDDIPILVDHFIGKFSERLNMPDLKITHAALRNMTTRSWEGNIRELENTIERAAILCNNSSIEIDDVIPEEGGKENSDKTPEINDDILGTLSGRLPDILDTIEKKMIKSALKDSGQVQAHAAEKLGITKSLLQYKMKKYRIARKNG